MKNILVLVFLGFNLIPYIMRFWYDSIIDSSDVDTIIFFWIIEAIMSDALCLRTHVVFIYFLLTVILLVKNCKENEWIKKLTTYSITKNPTRILSIIFIAYTASGYSGGAFLSSSDWNSGNVPNTKVNVDIRTTPRDVKAMIWNRNKKKILLLIFMQLLWCCYNIVRKIYI